ncbi:pyruvate dehydrogenase [acetyl-transferring]-phosphatase 2, mitochondrial-like isoform X1 [Acropora muricata]|uniref:pyruvate dehydrogenase [acetyl-transferring]-phosphatase 2, mitochondrial-like isoform X1 n=1 Tax=Acropora muricata TaxID=159855 RepID=UPI0034E3BE77
MNKAEVIGTFSKWKWPVVGVAAAFVGSMYTYGLNSNFTLKARTGNEDTSGVIGLGDLLQKLIQNFIQGSKGPEKPPLSPKEASQILRRNEKRTDVNVGAVSYYETNNFASNDPCEDRGNEWLLLKTNGAAFGVFDGHGGWQCAEVVKTRLPLYVALSLLSKVELTLVERDDLNGSSSTNKFVFSFQKDKSLPAEDNISSNSVGYTLSQKQEVFHTGPMYLVKNLIEKPFNNRMPIAESLSLAFTQLDDDISTEAIPVKVLDESFFVGATGACALISYIEGEQLYVANAGDCRAVLGSVNQDGSWLATPLTVDQTASNSEEVERLHAEHPGEENFVIKNGRLLGQLQPLRSFGDIQYKWDKVTHSHVLTQVYGGPIVPPSMYKTPPYLTAKPVVTQHHLQFHDKFLILATDGLWDVLSNEQAVGLVAEFLEQQGKYKAKASAAATSASQNDILEHNAATHLIRHALGGTDHDFVAQMLLVPDQYRRMWRDDITVTVVFFNSDTFLSKL